MVKQRTVISTTVMSIFQTNNGAINRCDVNSLDKEQCDKNGESNSLDKE